MKTVIMVLLLALFATSCASAPPLKQVPKYSGVCWHPAVNDGNKPFRIAADTKFDGPLMTIFRDEGGNILLYIAMCQLLEETP